MADEADGVDEGRRSGVHAHPAPPTTPSPYVVVTSVVCAVASVWQPAIGIAWIIGFLVWRDLLRAR